MVKLCLPYATLIAQAYFVLHIGCATSLLELLLELLRCPWQWLLPLRQALNQSKDYIPPSLRGLLSPCLGEVGYKSRGLRALSLSFCRALWPTMALKDYKLPRSWQG